MSSISYKNIIEQAQAIARSTRLSEDCTAGEVGCVIITTSGKQYRGISISAACGIGFCAEHAAVAAMVTDCESRIKQIVAVTGEGVVLPPCGRCRELLYQINRGNLEAEIVLGEQETALLRELLPRRWQDLWA